MNDSTQKVVVERTVPAPSGGWCSKRGSIPSAGGQTKVTLEHVGLADAEIRASHHDGWSYILAELSAFDGFVA